MNREKLRRKGKVKISQFAKNLEIARNNNKMGIVISIAGLVLFLFFGSMWFERNHEIQQLELKTIEGTVSKKFELKWSRTGGNSMTIKTKEYPNVDFVIGRFGTKALNTYLIREKVKIGDKIQIETKKYDFEKLNPSSDSRKKIAVYGVRDDEIEYLNVSGYNSEFKKDRNSIWSYIMLGICCFIFGTGIKLWISNKKLASNKVNIGPVG